jgi:hypothetical protein
VLKCGGGTDNRATGQLVQKRMSTKMPLMLILMDYLAYCEEKDIRCQLDWRPREVNIEADQLTNENFESFSLDNRIHILWENLSFPMITLLSSFAEGFSKRAGSIWSKASWREGQMCKDCLGVKRPLHWGFYLPLHPGCAATHSFTNGLAVLDVLTHLPFKFEMAPLHSCGKKALRE